MFSGRFLFFSSSCSVNICDLGVCVRAGAPRVFLRCHVESATSMHFCKFIDLVSHKNNYNMGYI